MTQLGHERIGDLVTLGVLAALFTTMTVLMLRRTWRWERLGIALTVMTGCLALSFWINAAAVATGSALWIPAVRYAIRSVLSLAGLVTLLVLLFDEPPKSPPRRHHHPVAPSTERNAK